MEDDTNLIEKTKIKVRDVILAGIVLIAVIGSITLKLSDLNEMLGAQALTIEKMETRLGIVEARQSVLVSQRSVATRDTLDRKYIERLKAELDTAQLQLEDLQSDYFKQQQTLEEYATALAKKE